MILRSSLKNVSVVKFSLFYCIFVSAHQVLDKHRAMDSMVDLLQVYPEEDAAFGELLEATTQLYHYLLQPFRDIREVATLRRQQIKVKHWGAQKRRPSVQALYLSRFRPHWTVWPSLCRRELSGYVAGFWLVWRPECCYWSPLLWYWHQFPRLVWYWWWHSKGSASEALFFIFFVPLSPRADYPAALVLLQQPLKPSVILQPQHSSQCTFLPRPPGGFDFVHRLQTAVLRRIANVWVVLNINILSGHYRCS